MQSLQGLVVATGDGNATLTWPAAPNNACVEFYNVTYMEIGPMGDRGPMAQTQTTALNYTFTGLANGVQYAFMVEVGFRVGRVRRHVFFTLLPTICYRKT